LRLAARTIIKERWKEEEIRCCRDYQITSPERETYEMSSEKRGDTDGGIEGEENSQKKIIWKS